MPTPADAPKEIAELLHFICGLGRVTVESYQDDGKISPIEIFGMVRLFGDAAQAFGGMEKIMAELDAMTPSQMVALADIPADYFHRLLPHQHVGISQAALACLPPLVNLIQTIRQASALAADFPGSPIPTTP